MNANHLLKTHVARVVVILGALVLLGARAILSQVCADLRRMI